MDPVIFKQILTAAAEVAKVTTDEKSGGPHAVTGPVVSAQVDVVK